MIFPIMEHFDNYVVYENFDEENLIAAIERFDSNFNLKPIKMFISGNLWAKSVMSPLIIRQFQPNTSIAEVREGRIGVIYNLSVYTDAFNEPTIIGNEVVHKANVDFNVQLSDANNNWLNCKFGV